MGLHLEIDISALNSIDRPAQSALNSRRVLAFEMYCYGLQCVLWCIAVFAVIKRFRNKGIERLFRKCELQGVQAQHALA